MVKSQATKLAIMGTEMKNVSKKLDGHINDQKEDFKIFNEKLDSLGEKLDKKYASKWVEKISVGSLIAIIAGLILFVITNGG